MKGRSVIEHSRSIIYLFIRPLIKQVHIVYHPYRAGKISGNTAII